MKCINCDNEHKEKFCPNCGEQANVPKITFSSIFTDAFSTIMEMDKGFLFNVKQLFLRPRKIVLDYIQGKRKEIFSPVSFLIISVTIYLIGESLIYVATEESGIKSESYSFGKEIGQFIKTHFKYFWILSIIWLSVSTRLIFRTYNFAEHLAINSFVIGQATLAGLIGLLLFKVPIIFDPITYALILWMTYQIFKTKDKDWRTLLKSLASIILFFIQLALIAAIIGFIRR